MENTIACNLGSYRQFRASAYRNLAEIGLTNVEVPLPPPGEVAGTLAELERHGLTATTVMVRGDAAEDDAVERFGRDLEGAREMGVSRVFTSVRAGEADVDVIYDRLRQIGDRAAELDILVCLETHPDLLENGARARQTMDAVGHANIRVNFDTANVHYYNRDISATDELRQVLDCVEAVHLKDTNGGYKTWHFPALGEGVVDFTAVFAMLNERGFYGPFTMELEGIEGEDLDEAGVQKRVADSLEHLRSIGCAA